MAAVCSCTATLRLFECRSRIDFSDSNPHPEIIKVGASLFLNKTFPVSHGLSSSSLIGRFQTNFVRKLRTKPETSPFTLAAKAIVDASAASFTAPIIPTGADVVDKGLCEGKNVQADGFAIATNPAYLTGRSSMAIHAGERLGRSIVSDSITTPVYNTTAHFFKNTQELIDSKVKRHRSFEYGRYGNYTTEVLEDKMSALEGAESTLFLASGMCACSVLLLALVPKGGHIVTTSDCYHNTRKFIDTFLVPNLGVKVTVIDPADVETLEVALNMPDHVSMFFTESPTNPFLRCIDIELVSKLCHEKGAMVCIDGTCASPINQRALSLGADLVVNSATKYIAGHNDVLAGCVSGSKKLVSALRDLHHMLGGTLNPNAAYQIIRGMKTLELRVQQQNKTASRISKILEAHPKVKRVYYPGLASHPEHELAKKQMFGFGGVVSFEIDGDLHKTAKFIDALSIPYTAPSFGGVESIVAQPAIMSYWNLSQPERARYGILDNLVRFSFGVEDFEDLKSDVLQALKVI